uniref:Poxvirus F12L protein n=1 Tax=Myoviridae sp. ctkfK18 TaxID=2825165 RepID=A0A8S5VGH8_9CAUD|nr:MAG TPA: Poxvirus F12L protein [Myoviridae sp. ctkfK18]
MFTSLILIFLLVLLSTLNYIKNNLIINIDYIVIVGYFSNFSHNTLLQSYSQNIFII